MSLAPYYYRPITPPELAAGQPRLSHHARHISDSSCYTENTSPESVLTRNTTPSPAPVFRQHGPTLLPKIRTQDATLAPSTKPKSTHRRVLSTASNVSAYHPYQRPHVQRSQTEPVECSTLMSPVSMVSFPSRASSVIPESLSVPNAYRRGHSRSVSASSIDESVLNRYGYPTYRQLPVYMSNTQQAPSPTTYEAPQPTMFFPNQYPLLEPPSINIEGTFDMPFDLTEDYSRPSSLSPPPPALDMAAQPVLPAQALCSTSVLTYLTQPTQPINLARQLTFPTGRGFSSQFWWDVRNVRTWEAFNLDTMFAVPDLLNLLNFEHDDLSFPTLPNPSVTANPASETDLANCVSKIYLPAVNAATSLSLGANAIRLYNCPQPTNATGQKECQPTFLANHPSDSSQTLTGLPRSRLIGLVKSFDKWNTGMRHSTPAKRVEYLKGLSHLQKCMRDHSCRYGFIITEIELVCVRAGCDETGRPYFGKLELADAIPLKSAAPADDSISMTVSLALYYLLLLSKSSPLPGQASGFMDAGSHGTLSRQYVFDGTDLDESERGREGRDKWIPEPQMGEKRDAKTCRGWVWPADPWHRREGGAQGRRRVSGGI